MEVVENISRRAAERAQLSLGGSSGMWVFLLLALVGLGGGLFIAMFSFNSPEGSVRIGPIQKELLYARPVLAALPAETAKVAEAAQVIEPAGAEQLPVAGLQGEGFSSVSLALSNQGAENGPLPDAWGFPADAGNLMTPASLTTALADLSGSSVGSEHGYQAQTAAAVPEPATWALMFAGFGGLVALRRLQKRGR